MNLLITSVGRRTYLVNYFKEALNGMGLVHVANSTPVSPAFLVADNTVVTPLIYDEAYIPFLLNYCKENEIDAVISLFDIDLPILAKNKDKFEQIGVKVVVSDYSIIDVCNDKWKSYLFFKNNLIPTPKTYFSKEEALKALAVNEISYPIIIKPRWGIGTAQVYEVDDEEELEVLYRKAQKGIMKSYLKYESGTDIEHCILFQEKLKGQEYGLDVINDLQGNYITTIVKEKYAMRSGETDCAIIVNEDALLEIGKILGKSLKHIANLDVDVFLDGNGNPFVLEMNARFGGGYPFSHLAGVNEPRAIISWLRNEVAEEDDLKAKIGVIGQKDISLVKLN